MKTKSKKGKGHGHPWIVGIIGIIAAVILYINLPKFKLISGTVLLIALSHLVIAGIVLISAYMVSPQKLIYRLFEKRKLRKMKDKFYFGWSFGWMNMFWISACVIILAALLLYLGESETVVAFIHYVSDLY